MPLNHLELQPQIQQFARDARQNQMKYQEKMKDALGQLQICAKQPYDALRESCQASGQRCALPITEEINRSFPCQPGDLNCVILAADGSQIISSGHEAVPLSLINTSLICLNTGSSQAPEVITHSEIIKEEENAEIGSLSEDLIRLKRDVAEMQILRSWQNNQGLPVLALRDGPLELYHEPRQGRQFDEYFSEYIQLLNDIAHKEFILAGYIDRSRAALITNMLSICAAGANNDIAGLRDTTLLASILPAGQRSAIFELQSSSSDRFPKRVRIHFFYLNVSSTDRPYIVRVEIPVWVAQAPDKINLLHLALLEQCRLLGNRPYPYLLHRAHETAVVHFEEKTQLQDRLALELQKQGLGYPQPSNKLSAKEL